MPATMGYVPLAMPIISWKMVTASAVKVTADITNIGTHSIMLRRFVRLRNTAHATSASADSNWLEAPNSGQIDA